MNDDWTPKIKGGHSYNPPNPFRNQRQRNKLQDSDNPIVRRLGQFLYEEPDEGMPTGMRAMGGLILGLHVARMLDADELDDLLRSIYSVTGDGFRAEADADRMARDCIEGTGPWEND